METAPSIEYVLVQEPDLAALISALVGDSPHSPSLGKRLSDVASMLEGIESSLARIADSLEVMAEPKGQP